MFVVHVGEINQRATQKVFFVLGTWLLRTFSVSIIIKMQQNTNVQFFITFAWTVSVPTTLFKTHKKEEKADRGGVPVFKNSLWVILSA